MPRRPRYTEADAAAAIAASLTYTEALRRLGMCTTGGSHKTLRRYAEEVWHIPTDHFDPDAARRPRGRDVVPLADVLVTGSSYSRRRLKARLFASGLKHRACEMCGQDEHWRGRRMALVLDHINGVRDDNRIDNLRILCPNCNATLDTHCGRNSRRATEARACAGCGRPFTPRRARQRYCSRTCGQRAPRAARLGRRPRPSREQLAAEVAADGWTAVGRRYGVSDNAVRKWVRGGERSSLTTD